MSLSFVRSFAVICAVICTLRCSCLHAGEWTKEQLTFFETKIRPLLIDRCYECHSAESGESEGDLLLDSADAIAQGGTMGRALSPGKPDASLLMKAVLYEDVDLQMPPAGKLPQSEIDLLTRWIQIGAPDPRKGVVREKSASPLERDPRTHWAYVPAKFARIGVDVGISDSSRDLIDSYAAAAAETANTKHAAPATPDELIRRLYFDLTGLVPMASDIDQFVQSKRFDAYERLVDRLLASPEFGERFGRHWLDVSRYADTVGYALGGKERKIKGSEQFRDWVIGAFNRDMPYDQMVLYQLAGDHLDPNNETGNLAAMGFLTVGRKFLNGLDTIDDRIDVISRGLLGMTVACARCHDHKFDPIPTSDYYSLAGMIQSSQHKPDGASPLMMVDKSMPRDENVLIRGQRGNRGPVAQRQFLTALQRPNEPVFDKQRSGRLQFAKRVVAKDNPLTARVIVNRVWTTLIGKPLVDSPSDFGFRTPAPAIPQILDDLAADLQTDWSIKRLVKRIVLSRVYRQSSKSSDATREADPENTLLTRANRRRRDFESLRDVLLQLSGSLDLQQGGPSVEITLPDPVGRRTVYAFINRQNLPSVFRTFDFASPDTHSPQRYFTTVPQQALFLLNGKQVTELARRTAMSAREGAKATEPKEFSNNLFRRIYGRNATPQELVWAADFLNMPASGEVVSVDPRELWSYGYGSVGKDYALKSFTPFSVFEGGSWRVADKFPTSAPHGHLTLSNENGHPGNSNEYSVVRRWRAPADGEVRIIGMMGHRGEKGDGVQATIWAGKRRIFSNPQKRNNRPYGPLSATVSKGDYISLIASPQESSSYDSFFWRAKIKLSTDDGRVFEADSVKDFSGPFDAQSVKPLDRAEQLAHALLISNEFIFVD